MGANRTQFREGWLVVRVRRSASPGFERRARVAASLPATVSREGMLLYGL